MFANNASTITAENLDKLVLNYIKTNYTFTDWSRGEYAARTIACALGYYTKSIENSLIRLENYNFISKQITNDNASDNDRYFWAWKNETANLTPVLRTRA